MPQAYTQLGDLDVAKRHYGEALRHNPDHAEAQKAFSAAKRLAKLKSLVRMHYTHSLSVVPQHLPCFLDARSGIHLHAQRQLNLVMIVGLHGCMLGVCIACVGTD